MADNIFEEYKAYYRTRAERYANNSNYRNSYEAESTLRDAFLSCNEMGEFRNKIGNLNYKCSSALLKDKYLMEQTFFNELEEVVRVLAANRILDNVDNYDNVMDLMTMIGKEETKCMIEISMDTANREFHSNWRSMDSIEIYENAVVPDEYKQGMQETANSIRQSIIDSVKRLEENNSHWQAGWKLTPDIIWEHRHRELLPYKDEHIEEQLQKFKSITNR
jgi:hypothetical protein